jgi:hypothetical protein
VSLARLEGYALSSDRMPVIRALAERTCGLADAVAILDAFRDRDRKLIARAPSITGNLQRL